MSDHLNLRGRRALEAGHTPAAIARRLAGETSHNYLRDVVFGAIDGTVTTFAIVAGVAGAGLSGGVALVLGLANLLADGFSMAASNYLGTKSEHELVERAREVEAAHIQQVPHGEREEIRQIFAAKGFEGELLEQVVDVITTDRRRWIDTMITEEFGLRLAGPSPLQAASWTFGAFVVAGAVPLVPLVLGGEGWSAQQRFLTSAVATAATFFLIGLLKGYAADRPLARSAIETLLVGGGAAALAYLVGMWLKGIAAG